MTFTPAEIDRWLEAAFKKCEGSEFQDPYKAGWRAGITAVMIEFDDAKKRIPLRHRPDGSVMVARQ